jgi:hypothetical protein
VAHFKVLSRNSPGGTDENHERLSQDSWSPGTDSNPGSSEYQARVSSVNRKLSHA